MKVENITIIGLGLIGGSFALALKKANCTARITGFGRHEQSLQKGVDLNVIDQFTLDPKEAVREADMIFFAVPVGAMTESLNQIKPFLDPRTIITDAGSSKLSVINSVRTVFGEIPENFVAGHPIAGKEQSGVEAACPELYQGQRVILTPTKETNPDALNTTRNLWQKTGANVSEMRPDYHDEVLAATSHLPHLLAYGLVNMLNEHHELGDVFQYTAGGFRDFTRIASSDATMWRDISLHNKDAIIKWIDNYQEELEHLKHLLDQENGEALHQLFSEAKLARDTHILKI